MQNSTKVLVVLAVLMLTALVIFPPQENFTTKQSKAKSIYDWFKTNPNPKYIKYRADLANASNIVEYEDALSLFQRSSAVDFTIPAIEKII